MNRSVEYRDITIKPTHRGGRVRRTRVATEIRPVGKVRLGNKVLWEGTIVVVTQDRKAR